MILENCFNKITEQSKFLQRLEVRSMISWVWNYIFPEMDVTMFNRRVTSRNRIDLWSEEFKDTDKVLTPASLDLFEKELGALLGK